MAVSITTFKVNKKGGDVLIQLEALDALPIEGVMSSFSREVIEAGADDEPTVTTFRLPPVTKRYVVYGVVTPLKRIWGSPKYERSVLQDGELIASKAKNPAKFKARKINAGEYVGPPEVISIEAK